MTGRRHVGWKSIARQPRIVLGIVLVLLLVHFGVISIGERPGENAPAPKGDSSAITGEASAIDGDTLRIGGAKVRLLGLTAPERHEPGGAEATRFMQRTLDGRELRCELTGEKSYDRLVGRCYLNGSDVAEMLIAEGLARDCPRYSGGRYARFEQPEAMSLPLPGYCAPR